MRIISGTFKSIVLHPPKGLPVRPTTDRAKESLFNIITNQFDITDLDVLDLFSGTGNIAFEFASRGARDITSVDLNARCVAFIKATKEKLNIPHMKVIKSDAFSFLKKQETSFDLIFADAPYAMKQIIELPRIVAEKQLLKAGGWLIVEHESHLDLSTEIGFFDKRTYGQSAFSFFRTGNE